MLRIHICRIQELHQRFQNCVFKNGFLNTLKINIPNADKISQQQQKSSSGKNPTNHIKNLNSYIY
jgi:hypothetical protein